MLHELTRLATLPMIAPSPTSGFHSSYYLGLGWGVAEATWGIVQGWEQLSLYEDVLRHPDLDDSEQIAGVSALGLTGPGVPAAIGDADEGYISDFERAQEMEEAELERKVEALERMRERRGKLSAGLGSHADELTHVKDLEEVIGAPFPNIPIALHLLWRLDTLLLNLGLTLILSAYYFNSYPIYHGPEPHNHNNAEITPYSSAARPDHPSPHLWLVWGLVAFLHVCVSLVWKVVGRVGIGAVTWGVSNFLFRW